jgi:hypothetical protein
MASSAPFKMPSWVVAAWLTILIFYRSCSSNMKGKEPPLDALLKLISGKLLTQSNGHSCGIYFSFLVFLIDLFTLL